MKPKHFFLYFGSVDGVNVRLSEAKRGWEAKCIFKVIQFNGSRRLYEQGLRSTALLYNHVRIYKSSAVTK